MFAIPENFCVEDVQCENSKEAPLSEESNETQSEWGWDTDSEGSHLDAPAVEDDVSAWQAEGWGVPPVVTIQCPFPCEGYFYGTALDGSFQLYQQGSFSPSSCTFQAPSPADSIVGPVWGFDHTLAYMQSIPSEIVTESMVPSTQSSVGDATEEIAQGLPDTASMDGLKAPSSANGIVGPVWGFDHTFAYMQAIPGEYVTEPMMPSTPLSVEDATEEIAKVLPDKASIDGLKGDEARCTSVLTLLENEAAHSQLVEMLLPQLFALSLTKCGTRVAQRLAEVLGPRLEEALMQFHGRVQELYESKHGNYFLQKLVEISPVALVQFIIEESRGKAVAMSRHRFGCRVMERLIDHCPFDRIEPLIEELLPEVVSLCKDAFANYVLKRILEQAQLVWRERVAQQLAGSIATLAKHRSGSHVLQQAWLFTDGYRQRQMARELVTSESPSLTDVACSGYGAATLKEIFRVAGSNSESLRVRLQEDVDSLLQCDHGRSVIQCLGLVAGSTQGYGATL